MSNKLKVGDKVCQGGKSDSIREMIKSMSNKLKVGDKVYQGEKSDSILEMTVKKVGRKFFYVERGLKYDLKTRILATDYGHKPQCYTSRQELEDVLEADDLNSALGTMLRGYGRSPYSVDQLRRVKAILDESA